MIVYSNTILILLGLGALVVAQNETEKLPNFGDSINILGAVSVSHVSTECTKDFANRQ
jgi:hypothetical protein